MHSVFLGLHAETSMHAGAGAALDVIDLPIQREAHTGWPCVFGSAVKGALRAAAAARDIAHIDIVFGPAPDRQASDASAYAGALMVGDARLLLLPVRSLTGYFKWVTCPALLQRLKRDAHRLAIPGFDFAVPELVGSTQAKGLYAAERLFLEEYCFSVQAEPALSEVVKALTRLSDVAGFDTNLPKQLLLVADEDFGFLCRHATPVTPHIALDSEKKTTKDGALWFEETLPPETLLYAGIAANNGRNKDALLSAADVIKAGITQLFAGKPYLQLGGNETAGMGWCKVTLCDGREA